MKRYSFRYSGLKTIFSLAILNMFLLTAAPVGAEISVVNSSGEFVNDVADTYDLENVPYTNSSFNAGTADKLIVTVIAGDDGINVPNPTMKYGGSTLSLVANTSWGNTERQKGIYYLDAPASSGDLVFDFTASTNVNGFAYGVVSIAGSADGTAEVAVRSGNNGGVTITPSSDRSFIVASFAAQQDVSDLTNTLTQIIPDGAFYGYASRRPEARERLGTNWMRLSRREPIRIVASYITNETPPPLSLPFRLRSLGMSMILQVRRQWHVAAFPRAQVE